MTLLPSDETKSKTARRVLPGGAWLTYDPKFLKPSSADRLLHTLLEDVVWEQRTIVLFGRRILQPRLLGWASAMPYRYSGQTLEPRAIPASMRPVIERVRARVGVTFNHVLINRYRNGHDAMGMHSDDEPELGENPVLASLSLGVARRFVIVPRKKAVPIRKIELLLTHGSLLTMGGRTQHAYRHGVPRQRSVSGERVNLTFRHLLTIPAP